MNSSTTQQMQPETLTALNNFIEQWNADPASSTNTLLIIRNQFSLIDGNLFETLSSTENISDNNNLEITPSTDPDTFEQLSKEIDFDPYNEETIEIANLSEENIDSSNIFYTDTEQAQPSSITQTSRKDSVLSKIRNDLTMIHTELPIRASPLLTTLFEGQLKEIISRLQSGIRGKNRDRQIRTLEACYHLESLRIAHHDNFSKLQEIDQTLRNTLGRRRANVVSNGAQRIFKILELCGKEKLYSTKYITLSNLFRLTDDSFSILLEALGTHGVRF